MHGAILVDRGVTAPGNKENGRKQSRPVITNNAMLFVQPFTFQREDSIKTNWNVSQKYLKSAPNPLIRTMAELEK